MAARGAGELNTLGSYAGDEPPLRALADQANLTLGYWLLRNQRARQARRVLWRIPLNSPLARKALLALGWSEFLSTEFEQPLIKVEKKACERAPAVLWNNADPLHKVPRNNCRISQVKNKKALLAAPPPATPIQPASSSAPRSHGRPPSATATWPTRWLPKR